MLNLILMFISGVCFTAAAHFYGRMIAWRQADKLFVRLQQDMLGAVDDILIAKFGTNPPAKPDIKLVKH